MWSSGKRVRAHVSYKDRFVSLIPLSVNFLALYMYFFYPENDILH